MCICSEIFISSDYGWETAETDGGNVIRLGDYLYTQKGLGSWQRFSIQDGSPYLHSYSIERIGFSSDENCADAPYIADTEQLKAWYSQDHNSFIYIDRISDKLCKLVGGSSSQLIVSQGPYNYGVEYQNSAGTIHQVFLFGEVGGTQYLNRLDLTSVVAGSINPFYDHTENLLTGLNFSEVAKVDMENNTLVISGTATNGALTTAYLNPETLEATQAPARRLITSKPVRVQ